MKLTYTTAEGTVYSYTADEEGTATITSIDPCSGELRVPERLGEDVIVSVIGRKCCLGAGRLLAVDLPRSIKIVDDWAFAGCRRLKRVGMPRAALGTGVFQDCEHLRAVELTNTEDEDATLLLAALSQRKDAAYLTDLKEAGTEEWYRRIDVWLEKLLETSDQEGYSGQVPCGEEDYGSSDVGAYESGRRREKCELALLRLLCPRRLSEQLKERLRAYAVAHTAGSEQGEECWQVILQKHPEERAWYEMFVQIGGITEANRDRILRQIPEEYVELKSCMINAGGPPEGGSFLAGLEL